MNDNLTATSKFLSYVLRHHPESIGLTLDTNGWVDVDILLQQAAQHNRPISREFLQQVVEQNSKKRFTLSEDGRQIRAAQGHSTAQVNLSFAPVTPPEILYHGTASHFVASILQEGLRSGSRHHVHLSADVATATQVGQRHGKPIVLQIKAAALHRAGHAFYLSDNHVWLTDFVPPEFLSTL